MPIEINAVAVFSLGGILGFLARTIIDHRLAIARNYEAIKATEFNKGAAEFRAVFTGEIYILRKNVKSGNEFLHNIITDNTFVAHNKAKILFEPFLSGKEISEFNEAWLKYVNCEVDYFRECKGVFNPANIDSRKELSEKYLSCIEHLLSLAKPKIDT